MRPQRRVLRAWRDTPSGAPAPCVTAGQCRHGYFQYFARNDIFVMFHHWQFAQGFCGRQTGLGRLQLCKPPGCQAWASPLRGWQAGLGVHAPPRASLRGQSHMQWHFVAPCSAWPGRPLCPRPRAPLGPKPRGRANPAVDFWSNCHLPHPLLTLLAPSSHQEPQRALRA